MRKTTKKTIALTAIAAIAIAAVPSCKMQKTYVTACINGEKWSFEDEPEPKELYAEYKDDDLLIGGWSENPQYVDEIQMIVLNPSKGTFLFAETTCNYAEIWFVEDDDYEAYYSNEEGCSGSVTITRLTETCVAGKFSFTAENGYGDRIQITKGRFRIPIDTVDF